MRVLVVACVLAACSHSAPPPTRAPVANATPSGHSCADAAHGLEGATRGVREPENGVYETLLHDCTEDGWVESARNCFANMREGELETCSRMLNEQQRLALFDLLGDRLNLAQARTRLDAIHVGVPPCDDYVGAVRKALDCEGLTVDVRVQLGTEAANFWSIPRKRLDAVGQQKIVDLCVSGLEQLHHAVEGVCVL